jgi:hypothetical protein
MKKLIQTTFLVVVFITTVIYSKRIKSEVLEVYTNTIDFMANNTTVSPLGI